MKFYFSIALVFLMAIFFISAESKNLNPICPSLQMIGINKISRENSYALFRPNVPRCPILAKGQDCYVAESYNGADWLFIIETSAKNKKDALEKLNNSAIFSAKTKGNPYAKQGCEITVGDINLRMWNFRYDKNRSIATDALMETTVRPFDINDFSRKKE